MRQAPNADMDAFETALITLLGCNALFLVLALPLVGRKVPRNRMYGFRTPATLRTDVVWFEANAHFGRRMVAASVFSAAAMVVLYYTALSPVIFVYTASGTLAGSLVAAVLDTSMYLRKLSRHVRAQHESP